MKQIKVTYEGNTYSTPTAHRMIAVKMLNDYCKKYKYNYKEIIGRDKQTDLVVRRARAARHLIKSGLSLSSIGYALNKHHTTILNYKLPHFDWLDRG